MASVTELDAVLPQTQCGECSYAGCLPYAEALAQKTAPINKCPPGGVTTVKALAALLHTDAAPYLAEAEANTRPPSKAVIREKECIGCTKCIKACPVDAIIGSGKLMHAVLTHECTGCGLCVAPCPVDCIDMVTLNEQRYDPKIARARFHARQIRVLREQQEQHQHYQQKRQLIRNTADGARDIEAKQEYIQRALARVAAKKSHE